MKKFKYTLTRVYETIIEIEAKDEFDADKKISELDIYQIESDQCNVLYEKLKIDDDFCFDDNVLSMFLNQINR